MALLSPKQVAEKYGFHHTHIHRLIREGLIKFKKLGVRCYMIDEKDLKGLKRRRSPNGTRRKKG